MQLAEIDATIRSLTNQIMEYAEKNEGMIPEDLSAQLENLECVKDDKISSLCFVVKELKLEVSALEEYKKNIADKITTRKNSIEFLRSLIDSSLNGGKYKSIHHSVYPMTTKSVVVPDSWVDENIPQEYRKTEYSVKKDSLKSDLLSGKYVEGCFIDENKTIIIR